MQDPFAANLELVMSPERLGSYQRRNVVENEVDVIARYAWNMALSEALYPALQGVEVALRNSIHQAISNKLGNPSWFDSTPPVLRPIEQNAVAEAKRTLTDRGKPIEPGRVIAELNLGFWRALFYPHYDQVFWPDLLQPVFPNMPRRIRTRKFLQERTNQIRNVRNRVFHYEPIWHWRDLRQQHDAIIETTGWISPELRTLTEVTDRFLEIYQQGPAPYRAKLIGHFQAE